MVPAKPSSVSVPFYNLKYYISRKETVLLLYNSKIDASFSISFEAPSTYPFHEPVHLSSMYGTSAAQVPVAQKDRNQLCKKPNLFNIFPSVHFYSISFPEDYNKKDHGR
jgi:hypothetical protein